MPRLVAISNRVPSLTGNVNAGGLAIGLKAALEESGGLWFGWGGGASDEPSAEVTVTEIGRIKLATIELSSKDYDRYYNGFSNRTLWPLFHGRQDLSSFDHDFYDGYRRVNESFADRILPLLKPDDRIWIHDYHLIPLGLELRERGVTAPIGFFLHIPFPPSEIFTVMPWHREIGAALSSYDLIGFQTERDRSNFCDAMVYGLGARLSAQGRISGHNYTAKTGVFPIGIDTAAFARAAASSAVARLGQGFDQCLQGKVGIIGVDRLDYTKGLVERFRSFERLLEKYPGYRDRVSLVEVAAPSREDVPEYCEVRGELEAIAGRINGRHSDINWLPIHYLNRAYSRNRLAAMYRRCRVGLVTPLRDGMNLVAKEYVAAQRPEDPGVLVLSRFAGAAERLDGALLVNPYDIEGVADALDIALKMPIEERYERWSSMFTEISRYDIFDWRDKFLAALEDAKDSRTLGLSAAE